MQQISQEVCDLVIEFGGAMSGEHGDGLARSYLNERLFGPRIYQAFKQIKAAFDPHNRMNPGKVVDGPSPVENLRYGADYQHDATCRPRSTSAARAGLRRRSSCATARACAARLQTGTMCPSFMVTRDEEHSTRGRANALRMVLSGALPPEELTGERLFATYDLCLQCKGCKAECPSNVDVAKLKMEFLDGYYREHGAPLGVRLMAHAATLNQARLGAGAGVELGRAAARRRLDCREAVGHRSAPPPAALRAQSFSQMVSPRTEVDRAERQRQRRAGRSCCWTIA